MGARGEKPATGRRRRAEDRRRTCTLQAVPTGRRPTERPAQRACAAAADGARRAAHVFGPVTRIRRALAIRMLGCTGLVHATPATHPPASAKRAPPPAAHRGAGCASVQCQSPSQHSQRAVAIESGLVNAGSSSNRQPAESVGAMVEAGAGEGGRSGGAGRRHGGLGVVCGTWLVEAVWRHARRLGTRGMRILLLTPE